MAVAIDFDTVAIARSFSIDKVEGEEQELALLQMTTEGQVGLTENRILPGFSYRVKANEDLLDILGIDPIEACTAYVFAKAFDNSGSGQYKMADLSITLTHLVNKDVPTGVLKPDHKDFTAPEGEWYAHVVKNERNQSISTLYRRTTVNKQVIWSEVSTRAEVARLAYVGDAPEEDTVLYRGVPRGPILNDYLSVELRKEVVEGKLWFNLVGIG